ncbi:hypothetical protein HYS48_00525 [Candidatus Woesearchaeota archaeon]|nr:hypothetical protein [Candidatus Woesearchaeota archaeon]
MGKKGAVVLGILFIFLISAILASAQETCLSKEELQQKKLEARQRYLLYHATERKLAMEAIIDSLQDRIDTAALQQMKEEFLQHMQEGQTTVDYGQLEEIVKKMQELIRAFKEAIEERKDIRDMKKFVQDILTMNRNTLHELLSRAREGEKDYFLSELNRAICTYTKRLEKEVKEQEQGGLYNPEKYLDRVRNIAGKRDHFLAALEEMHTACKDIPIQECKEGEVFDFQHLAEGVKEEFQDIKKALEQRKTIEDYEAEFEAVEDALNQVRKQLADGAAELEGTATYEDLKEEEAELVEMLDTAKQSFTEGDQKNADKYLEKVKVEILALEKRIARAKEKAAEAKEEETAENTTVNESTNATGG